METSQTAAPNGQSWGMLTLTLNFDTTILSRIHWSKADSVASRIQSWPALDFLYVHVPDFRCQLLRHEICSISLCDRYQFRKETLDEFAQEFKIHDSEFVGEF